MWRQRKVDEVDGGLPERRLPSVGLAVVWPKMKGQIMETRSVEVAGFKPAAILLGAICWLAVGLGV